MSRVPDRSRSPIVDGSLSDHESEDSYILVSPSHSRSSSNEWDDIHDEFQHEHEQQQQQPHDIPTEAETPIETETHEHEPQQEQIIDDDVQSSYTSIPDDQLVTESSPPSQPLSIDEIPLLNHTIDINDSEYDSDEEPEPESEPVMTESIQICRFHDDDDQERNLSMSQSFVASSPAGDLVSSLHVCDDTEPELPVVETQTHDEHEQEHATAHVDDAPDYPLASASTILCDPSWEHESSLTPSYSLLYDDPIITHDDPPLPDVYVDEYGYSHFERHPAFCLGEQECWEAKHIHDEQFKYDASCDTWYRGLDEDDMTYDDDATTYPDPTNISITHSHMHKKDPFMSNVRTRYGKGHANHQHVKQQQWSVPNTRTSSPPSPPSPQRSTYTSLRRRGRRSNSPSPSRDEPQFITKTKRTGSYKHRRPNLYQQIRDRVQHASTIAAQHQATQHLQDISNRHIKDTTTSWSDDMHIHGSNCNIHNCTHCRHVARHHKQRQHTKDRQLDRDIGNKMEHVGNDAWE